MSQKSPESKAKIRSYYVVLDRELRRMHELIKKEDPESMARTGFTTMLSKLHGAFYRNSLSDLGFNEEELKKLAPVLEIRGEKVGKA